MRLLSSVIFNPKRSECYPTKVHQAEVTVRKMPLLRILWSWGQYPSPLRRGKAELWAGIPEKSGNSLWKWRCYQLLFISSRSYSAWSSQSKLNSNIFNWKNKSTSCHSSQIPPAALLLHSRLFSDKRERYPSPHWEQITIKVLSRQITTTNLSQSVFSKDW